MTVLLATVLGMFVHAEPGSAADVEVAPRWLIGCWRCSDPLAWPGMECWSAGEAGALSGIVRRPGGSSAGAAAGDRTERIESRHGRLVLVGVHGFSTSDWPADDPYTMIAAGQDTIVFQRKRGEHTSRVTFRFVPPDSMVIEAVLTGSDVRMGETLGYRREPSDTTGAAR